MQCPSFRNISCLVKVILVRTRKNIESMLQSIITVCVTEWRERLYVCNCQIGFDVLSVQNKDLSLKLVFTASQSDPQNLRNNRQVYLCR